MEGFEQDDIFEPHPFSIIVTFRKSKHPTKLTERIHEKGR